MPRRGLFITGTDTGVGKTIVSAAIVRALREAGGRVGAYKPAASGSEPPGSNHWPDVEALHAALGGEFPRELVCPQRFHAPLAPPVAARLEDRQVDARLLRTGAASWDGKVDMLIVEGVGGLLCPLTGQDTVADLAGDLALPLIIVARAGLGTINHTLLTVEAACRRGLPVAGILLNASSPTAPGDHSATTNAAEIAARCSVPILAVLPFLPDGDLLQEPTFRRIDWLALCHHRPEEK